MRAAAVPQSGCRFHICSVTNIMKFFEQSTDILVKKVPDRVSHEDDLQVGVIALGGRLVLHLKKISALQRDGSAHCHVHFVADETESQGIQLL